jgi:hypothetical protein
MWLLEIMAAFPVNGMSPGIRFRQILLDRFIFVAVLRERLPDEGWNEFTRQVSDAFQAAFGPELEYDRDVHFGLAQKP